MKPGASLRVLLPLLTVFAACGTDGKKADEPGPQVDSNRDPRFLCQEEDEQFSIRINKESPFAALLCARSLAERAIWGKKITSSFAFSGKQDRTLFRDSVRVGEPIHSNELDRAEFAKQGKTLLPLPSQDKLKRLVEHVVSRYEQRCPSLFAVQKPWLPVSIKWRQAMQNNSVGHHSGIHGWMLNSKIARSSSDQSEDQIIDLAVTASDGEDVSLTWDEKEAMRPEEFRDVSEGMSWTLASYNKRVNYADDTLAHEIGHYVVDQIFWQSSKLNFQTAYFSEVLASWIGSLCYYSHLQEKPYLEETVARNESFGRARGELWPLGKLDFEIGSLVIDADLNGREFRVKGIGLGALYVAKSLDGEKPLVADQLFQATYKAIVSMQGRKLQCRSETKQNCAGTGLWINPELPLPRKPHVHTLAEFLVEFERALGEGGIPTRARGMWDRYKKVMETLEQ